jgi:hypothetical protein
MTRRFCSIYAVILALVLPGGATIIWDEPDGRTLYFVCSCQNSFTVRRVVLTTS